MIKTILATAVVMTLGAGSAFAGSDGTGNPAQPGYGQVPQSTDAPIMAGGGPGYDSTTTPDGQTIVHFHGNDWQQENNRPFSTTDGG